jgi:hypothetical protein
LRLERGTERVGRLLWLDRLPPEHEDLAQAVRSALLPEDSQVPGFEGLVMPELAAANEGGALADQGLQPGGHIGPHELSQRLGAGGERLTTCPIISPIAGANG